MTSRRTLVVGTRGSKLALRQTEMVAQALTEQHPGLKLDIREIKTEGDRRSNVSLASIGGQGVFVKELEASLSGGEIDLAVHSLKDVPADIAPGLTLGATPERADTRDALVTRDGATLATLPAGARLGTGSQRRAVQVRALRPDIETVDIRGNVDTRIRKVDERTVDATVLAAAGLARLGLLDRAAQLFSVEQMVPAVGQGAIAVEVRADDSELLDLLAAIDHPITHIACDAERAFMRRMGGGCRLPFGALATVDGETLHIRGFISDDDGSHSFRGELAAPASDAEGAGVRLAEDLLEQGAAPLVEAAQA